VCFRGYIQLQVCTARKLISYITVAMVQEAEAKAFAAGDEKHQGPNQKPVSTQVEIAMLFLLRIPVTS